MYQHYTRVTEIKDNVLLVYVSKVVCWPMKFESGTKLLTELVITAIMQIFQKFHRGHSAPLVFST